MVAVSVAALLLQAGVAPPPHAFSFFAAQFEPPDRAEAQARAFVADRLPGGLPASEARSRLQAAGMRCPSASSPTFMCRAAMLVHIGGGLIGEDTWSVLVDADGTGRIRSASLDHRVIGTGPPNPQ